MLHAITRENRHLYTKRLNEMYRLRYRIFVEEQKWDLPCSYPLEKDQFDTEDAIYFVYIAENDRIEGSLRFLPTTSSNLLSDVFPQLCSGGCPSASDILESSRGSVNRQHPDADKIWASIVAGSYEYCLLSGINKLSFIVDMKLFSSWIGRGADVTPLGPPAEINGSMCVAAIRDVTMEALITTRDSVNLKGPVLIYNRDLERAA